MSALSEGIILVELFTKLFIWVWVGSVVEYECKGNDTRVENNSKLN